MTDIIDRANEQMARTLLCELDHAYRPEPVIKVNGFCHFCDSPVPEGHRWCGAVCRDEWQKEQL